MGTLPYAAALAPREGTILFTRAEMNAWIQGIKAGEFDDMTS
jgi:hypothetical protein